LCADPTIDTNYNPVTHEFRGAPDGGTAGTGGGAGGAGGSAGGAGGGAGGSDAGVDAAVPNPGDDSGAGGSSGGNVDAPVTNPGDDSGTGSGGSGGSLGGASGRRDAGLPDGSATSCTGQAPTNFGQVATSDSDPHYTSGVGVLTSTEFLTFNAYVGPDSTDGGVADGGTATLVNRIDVQHFDPKTGKRKGDPTPLLTAAGDGSGLYINAAAVAPTGEIAIIYAAATGGTEWNDFGVYLAFLDKNLDLNQTKQFLALGLSRWQGRSHVQWLNGQFVASSVSGNNPQTIKLGKFAADGSNAGGTSAVPTDDPSGYVTSYDDWGQGEVAFSPGQFAVSYLNNSGRVPYLTILDTLGEEVGSPIPLPAATEANYGGSFVSVAGTSQGFVAVYNGSAPSTSAQSLLSTYVSNSDVGDAGVSDGGDIGTTPVGATHAYTGGYASGGYWGARGSSDGIGAGFAVLYPDGSVSFLYFSGDGSTRTSPQAVLQQVNPASGGDEVNLTNNYGGTFAVSLYSSAEHLTRMLASTCQ
jgi:hypothetical protein